MKKRQTSINKITRPTLSGILPRKRLFHLLDETRRRPVTWISAPAGYGKTTMVASYLDSRNLPCLWYQLDERDGDAASFFYYLGLAGKKASSSKKKSLPLLTPEYFKGITAFTKGYFEELFNRLKIPFVIVFDDYHEIPDQSLLNEVMTEGLSIIPPGINIIGISRKDPPPAMVRLIARRQITIIDESRLCFQCH